MRLGPPTLGLILAGGLARRMGGGDKARIRIGGVTILGRVLACLQPQCDRIIINANGDPGRFADTGLPVVPDSVPEPARVSVALRSPIGVCITRYQVPFAVMFTPSKPEELA